MRNNKKAKLQKNQGHQDQKINTTKHINSHHPFMLKSIYIKAMIICHLSLIRIAKINDV